MAKRQVYSFEEKKYSINGIASAVLGVLAIGALVVLLAAAFFLKGRASSWIGAMGLTGILMAFGGIRYGFVGFRDECKSYFCCKLGIVLGTISIAAWFFVVCLGLARG